MDIYLAGLRTGLGLIMVIGAQNAFVLRQGIRDEHVLPVVLICALSDALLIALGVAGFGAVTSAVPWLLTLLKWGGVAFLLWYGVRSFIAAYKGGERLEAKGEGGSLSKVLLTCLAFTWLNPHVYLDTVVLVGSIAAQFDEQAWTFGYGAMTGSLLFFAAIGFGARLIAPLFAKPAAWRVLDIVVGCLMWSVAAKLAFG